MTSLADQDDEQLGGPWSVLTRQKRDHVRLDELLHRLVAASGDAQREVLTEINRLVFPHAFAEESVLWPVIRRELPDGDELTLQIEEEHQEVNELVVRLEGEQLDLTTREALIKRLVEVLREDVRDEEDVLLPRLQEKLDVAELRRLGVTWEAVRRISPTRPHPVVSRRPPGNALAALPLTVIDRTRDRLDRAARRVPAARSALTSASQGLARGAGRMEHLKAFRRGEHDSTSRD
jgi:hypothetical protein